ncbi:MAG: BON domain-containing protein [Planctomycetota bacterium]|nr:BON domain-containing protein [Planctomycetota bacterium]
MRRLVVGLAIISLAAIALSWAQADDQEIAKEITERLKQEQEVGHLSDFDINLKVADGNVLLKGHVTSQEQQKLALETARSAKGVKHVVSDLQITPATPSTDAAKTAADTSAAEVPADGSPVSDSQIGEQLSAELKRRKDAGELKGFGLGISVKKGVVVLRGRVSSAEQLQLALDAAKQTPGVCDVVSHVVVVADVAPHDNPPSSEAAHLVASGKERRDEEISQEIAIAVKAQKAAGKLKAFDIDLAVEKGVATYTGQVPTAEQMKLVVDLARQTPGVRDVVNKLVVVSPAPQAKEEETAEPQAVAASPAQAAAPTDDDIARRIAASLKEQQAAGNLKGFDIDAVVENGIVTYSGHVANAAQLQRAMNVARQMQGVRDVVSQLVLPEAPAKTRPAEAEVAQAAPKVTPAAIEVTLADTKVAQAAPEETATQPIVTSASYHSERSDAPATDCAVEDQRIGEELTAGLDEAKRTGNLRGFGISVRVERSNVWLQGRVSSAEQRQLAADIARSVPGAGRITNDLSVRPVSMVVPTAYQGAYVEYPSAANGNGPVPVPVPAPRPLGAVQTAAYLGGAVVAAPFMAISQAVEGSPIPAHMPSPGAAQVPARYDHPNLPGYAWPSYAAYPNYAAVTYPKQYSPTAWPYIGPFYPYPQVPLGWRKVTLKWDDGWWQLNFKSK